MAVEPTTQPVDLDAEERKLFHEIKQLHAQSVVPTKINDYPQLNQTLDLTVFAGCNQIASYDINPKDIILQFANAGAQMFQKLIKNEPEIESQPGEGNDSDLVLGSQSQNDSGESDKTQDWNIPSCVMSVVFTVSKENMNPSNTKMLEEQYPGVILATEPLQLHQAEFKNTIEIEKPQGVKRVVIELDRVETDKNPNLEKQLRLQFPWASIESKSGPHPTRMRTLSISDSSPSSVLRLDPLQHLSDLAGYAIKPPPDEQFGYNIPLTESWATFPYSRKLEIAHARAIHGHYGRNADNGCTYCVERGYMCKVYRPQIANLTHINSGNSCQHCRLAKNECDLPAARRVQTLSRPAAELKVDTQIEPLACLADAMMTPSTAATPKPSLESRMTTNHGSVAIKSSESYVDERPLLTTDLLNAVHKGQDILKTAELIGLDLPGRSNTVIFSIHRQWKICRVVEPSDSQLSHVQHYYTNLVALYILAWARSEMSLAYAVLLRLQIVVSQRDTRDNLRELPDIETAVRAYQWLPPDAPLCRYMAIIFAFLWGTQLQGDYSTFVKKNPVINRSALTKLLYAIAYVRDPFVMGHDQAVLEHWCKVHDHSPGTEDDWELCQESRNRVDNPHEEREYARKGKRKIDGESAYPSRKKRGGNYGWSK